MPEEGEPGSLVSLLGTLSFSDNESVGLCCDPGIWGRRLMLILDAQNFKNCLLVVTHFAVSVGGDGASAPELLDGEPCAFEVGLISNPNKLRPVDARDGVAQDGVEGGEEEGVGRRVHQEQGAGEEEHLPQK